MFACICAAVDEREIRDAVDQGADTVFDVGCLTRAGTGCGGCHKRIERLIEVQESLCPALEHAIA